MPDLVVDGVGLTTLSSTPRRITRNLDATRRTIEGVRSHLGSSEAWEALDDSENKWDDGRGQIEKNMSSTRGLLDAAVKAYGDADQELSDSLTDPREA